MSLSLLNYEQDELNLKGPRRAAMYELAPQRKRYLLQQNQQFRKTAQKQKQSSPRNASNSMSVGPASSSGLIPRLVPQLTGDGLMKRFSIWGSSTATSPDTSENSTGSSHDANNIPTETSVQETQPIQPQTTGGLWTNWWASSGGDKKMNDSSKSAKSYADSIRSLKFTDIKLVKNLISLRVHLSTAKLVWISEFVNEEEGLDALASILSGLVGKGGKKRLLNDVELTVLLEVTKCLRALLNTEVSFFNTHLHRSFSPRPNSRVLIKCSYRKPLSLISLILCTRRH
jgi:diaphanous 1